MAVRSKRPDYFHFLNVRSDAPYADFQFTLQDFKQICADTNTPLSEFVEVPGFCPARLLWDPMHVLWHAGVGSDLGASCCHMLCLEHTWMPAGSELDEQLELACRECAAWGTPCAIDKISDASSSGQPFFIELSWELSQEIWGRLKRFRMLRVWVNLSSLNSPVFGNWVGSRVRGDFQTL